MMAARSANGCGGTSDARANSTIKVYYDHRRSPSILDCAIRAGVSNNNRGPAEFSESALFEIDIAEVRRSMSVRLK